MSDFFHKNKQTKSICLTEVCRSGPVLGACIMRPDPHDVAMKEFEKTVTLAVTGASGAPYALTLMRELIAQDVRLVHDFTGRGAGGLR